MCIRDRGAGQDVDDGRLVAALQGHVEAGHDGEVEADVKLVAVAKVGQQIFGPLVGLGDEDATGVLLVQQTAHRLQEDVGLRQILAVGALALIEIGYEMCIRDRAMAVPKGS